MRMRGVIEKILLILNFGSGYQNIADVNSDKNLYNDILEWNYFILTYCDVLACVLQYESLYDIKTEGISYDRNR